MEDFEFRPITEGLGFQKEEIKEEPSIKREAHARSQTDSHKAFLDETGAASSGQIRPDVQNLIDETLQPEPKQTSPFENKILPREGEKPKSQIPTLNPRTYAKHPTMDFRDTPDYNLKRTQALLEKERAELSETEVPKYHKTLGHVACYIFDGIVVLGLVSLFAASLSFATGIDLWALALTSELTVSFYITLAIMALTVLNIYMTLTRSFFGSTLGEWAFEIQVGTDEQRQSLLYPARIFSRALLNTVTGLVIFPLLSFIFRRDLLGQITGAELLIKGS